jgi:putative oxidoreductase
MPKQTFEGDGRRQEFRTIEAGCILQRLFSTFPDRWPGFGLLLMRLGIGTTLVCIGAARLLAEIPAPITIAQNMIAAGSGIFLIAGLWTPVTGAVAAINEICIALSFLSSQGGGGWIHILLAVLCASAAMLGPGAWSIDARLFGRRRFPIHRIRDGDHPPKG